LISTVVPNIAFTVSVVVAGQGLYSHLFSSTVGSDSDASVHVAERATMDELIRRAEQAEPVRAAHMPTVLYSHTSVFFEEPERSSNISIIELSSSVSIFADLDHPAPDIFARGPSPTPHRFVSATTRPCSAAFSTRTLSSRKLYCQTSPSHLLFAPPTKRQRPRLAGCHKLLAESSIL
jgi:hypothetical protein